MANFSGIKGAQVSLITRNLSRKKHRENENLRKRWKDLGRLNALKRQVNIGRFDREGQKLAKRFFDCYIEDLSAQQVAELESTKKEEVLKQQELHRSKQLSNWKKRMKNITNRGEWLNRVGTMKTPMVDDGDSFLPRLVML